MGGMCWLQMVGLLDAKIRFYRATLVVHLGKIIKGYMNARLSSYATGEAALHLVEINGLQAVGGGCHQHMQIDTRQQLKVDTPI